MTTVPATLPVIAANIPAELRDLPQWVGWRWLKRRDTEDWTKPPLDPKTGYFAKPNDATTWASFDAAWDCYQNGKADGVGFMFTDGGGRGGSLVGIDLDDCRDATTGALASWAYAIVQRLASYAEVSPSGTGVKVICRGAEALPVLGTNKPGGWPVEIYRAGRYFTLTGQRIEGAPGEVCDASEGVGWLYRRITTETPPEQSTALPAWVAPSSVAVAPDAEDEALRRPSTAWDAQDEAHRGGEAGPPPDATGAEGDAPDARRAHRKPQDGRSGAGTINPTAQGQNARPGGSYRLSDGDLLAVIGRSAQAGKFGRLMAGDASGYASPSQADIALCNLLAYYTEDAAQIDRVFRTSGLWREKWDEAHAADGRTYGRMTIDDALGYVRSRATYDPAYHNAPDGGRGESHRGGEGGAAADEPPDLWPPEFASAKTPPTAPRFRLYSARDALQPQPPTVWIVERLLTPGSVSAVVGAPGSKKTYSLLDMAVCVAMGKPWLNLATQQGAVLIVDEESGAARMARRLGGVLNAHFAEEDTPIFYTCLAGLNLRQAPEVDALRQLIAETGAAVVIIDALADIMPGADENAVKDVQPLLLALRRVADATRAAIVLIHHAGKNGDYRGSSAIKGAVDLMLTVQSEPDEDIVRFGFEKARDTEPFKFAGQAHFSDGLFWLSAIEEQSERPKSKPSPSENYVLRYLAEHGPAAVSDIASRADTCSVEAARRAIYSLAQRDLIRRTDDGRQGQAAVYALSQAEL